MKPAERQGHQLYAQGEARLKKMFGDKDKAKELFEKAAVQFKLASYQMKVLSATVEWQMYAVWIKMILVLQEHMWKVVKR